MIHSEYFSINVILISFALKIHNMMKRKLYILSIALVASASATEAFATTDTRSYFKANVEELLKEPKTTYNKEVVESPNWKGNWFIGINAGANAFIGDPVGCGDLKSRIKPHFGAYLGKWFTPTVGSRITYEGFQIKNVDKASQDYWGLSADFLWNLSSALYGNGEAPRLGIIPYIGVGMLHNRQTQTNPFALSYGVMAQFGITSRLKVTMELSGKTTFSDFDGVGKTNRFGGDNILSLSAGLSFTFGQNGFRKVIDAKPVLIHNARLREALADIYADNNRLSRQASNDARALAELKKIFEIEGLLSQYGDLFKSQYDNSEDVKRYPVNDYSGLNSLRARLKGYKGFGQGFANNGKEPGDDSTDFIDAIFASDNLGDSTLVDNNDLASDLDKSSNGERTVPGNGLSGDEYLALIASGKKCVGSPILFFFHLGTCNLTDSSQLVNLDEIARVANTYGLSIRVTGAADSATGTASINSGLGNDRADYIITELQKRGIAPSLITKINCGGIDALNPKEANRHCKIELFLK